MCLINYSFIIPHKDTPQLLRKCIESIPQRKDIEVIVVDNNSSSSIVDFDHFPGSERTDVRVVFDKRSVGAGGARNVGMNVANGRWILFADSDDFYTEGVIDVLDKYLESDVDVIFFNYQLIKNGVASCNPFSMRYLNGNLPNSGKDLDLLRFRWTVAWNKMISREFVTKHNIKFGDDIVGNDIFFAYQIGYYAKSILVEQKKLYNYVVNRYGISNSKNCDENYYLCTLMHIYQSHEFLKMVGHKEWHKSLSRRIFTTLIKKGWTHFFLILKVYIKNRSELYHKKNYFVNSIIK